MIRIGLRSDHPLRSPKSDSHEQTNVLTENRLLISVSNGLVSESAHKRKEIGVNYLDELPRCPVCHRVLRTRNDRPWCVDCERFTDG